jgi:hypothetical protein
MKPLIMQFLYMLLLLSLTFATSPQHFVLAEYELQLGLSASGSSHAKGIKITVLWDMTPCSLIGIMGASRVGAGCVGGTGRWLCACALCC